MLMQNAECRMQNECKPEYKFIMYFALIALYCVRVSNIISLFNLRIDFMAKKAMVNKQQRPAKFSTRAYTRCNVCGRPHSVLKKYGICRICFRNMAYRGEIPGVRKSSW